MINKKIESPCKNKCELNSLKTHCVGCYRTISEIRLWNDFSDKVKLEIIDRAKVRKNMDSSYVPSGFYCYSFKNNAFGENEFVICPFWGLNTSMETQSNGFCMLTGDCDWHEDSMGLLWDQCKSCGINDDDD